jgi:predicted TIM-barrel fold metal-dependent hydrolase
VTPVTGPVQQRVFDFHVRLRPGPGALDALLATMDGCGIARAAAAPGGAIGLGTLSRQVVEGGHVEVDADNDAVLAACRSSGGRLLPFYLGNPHRPAERYAEVAGSFRGLELSPALHGVPLLDPRCTELVAVAEQAGHPVYVVCLPRAGAGVADLVELARRFPDTTFVLGHLGVSLIDTYAVELVADRQNVLVDTSGGYPVVVRAALDRLGPDRLLFAAEHPLQHPRVELVKIATLKLPPDVWRKVAWENALRVLEEDPA